MADSNRFILQVKSPKKPVVKVEVEEDMTVFDAKNIIHLTHYDDIPVENMRAVFKGKILDNDSTLAECNVKNGMTMIIVNMPDTSQKQEEAPSSSSSDNSNSPPDPNLFSNMLANLLSQAGSAASGASGENARSGAQGAGFNWEALIPMFLGFANQIRGQVNRENIEMLLQNPQVQAFAQQFKDLPSKAVTMLAKFYHSSEQFQSLVEMIKKGLMEAQTANATNLSIVVTIGILLSWIEKFTRMNPEEAQQRSASNNSGAANSGGLDLAGILGGLLASGSGSNANGGVDIGSIVNNVLQGGMAFAQTMQNAAAPQNNAQPSNPNANQQQANDTHLDDILDSVLDDDANDLERLD